MWRAQVPTVKVDQRKTYLQKKGGAKYKAPIGKTEVKEGEIRDQLTAKMGLET